jgi:hypothetical protein
MASKKSDLWHQKLEHFYVQSLTKMEINDLVEGMDLNRDHGLSLCDGCV